jgi:hypothetical protein
MGTKANRLTGLGLVGVAALGVFTFEAGNFSGPPKPAGLTTRMEFRVADAGATAIFYVVAIRDDRGDRVQRPSVGRTFRIERRAGSGWVVAATLKTDRAGEGNGRLARQPAGTKAYRVVIPGNPTVISPTMVLVDQSKRKTGMQK